MTAWDPNNIPTRLSIGDLLVREDLSGEPTEAFEMLLAEVQYRADSEQTVLVARHLLERDPAHYDALAGLVESMRQLDIVDEAIPYLQCALMQAPDDIPLRKLLAAAHENDGENTAASLVRQEIAHLYATRGENTAARMVLAPVAIADSYDTSATITLHSVIEADSCPSLPAL